MSSASSSPPCGLLGATVKCACVHPSTVYSCSADGTVLAWNASSLQVTGRFQVRGGGALGYQTARRPPLVLCPGYPARPRIGHAFSSASNGASEYRFLLAPCSHIPSGVRLPAAHPFPCPLPVLLPLPVPPLSLASSPVLLPPLIPLPLRVPLPLSLPLPPLPLPPALAAPLGLWLRLPRSPPGPILCVLMCVVLSRHFAEGPGGDEEVRALRRGFLFMNTTHTKVACFEGFIACARSHA